MMQIAVFNEDEDELRMGMARLMARIPAYFYLSSDGDQPVPITGDNGNTRKFWSNPSRWIDGLNQKTCRDNGHHSQFALGSALHVSEVAWHQGIDVYAGNSLRYTAAMELLAKQFLVGSMLGVCTNDIPTADRFDTWEIGYNHYHNRLGMALPNTEKLITEQISPMAARSDWNLNYETLTHAIIPADVPSIRGHCPNK